MDWRLQWSHQNFNSYPSKAVGSQTNAQVSAGERLDMNFHWEWLPRRCQPDKWRGRRRKPLVPHSYWSCMNLKRERERWNRACNMSGEKQISVHIRRQGCDTHKMKNLDKILMPPMKLMDDLLANWALHSQRFLVCFFTFMLLTNFFFFFKYGCNGS